MFQIKQEKGSAGIYTGGSKLFTIDKIIFTLRDREEEACPAMDEEAPSCLTAVSETVTGRLTMQSQEASAIFRIQADITQKQPLFGPQNYFHEDRAVTLTLKPAFDTPAMGIYQHKDWWLRPTFVPDLKELPGRTQLVIAKQGEQYIVLMAYCGQDYRADMNGGEDGLQIRLSSNTAGLRECSDTFWGIGAGSDPYAVCHTLARQLLSADGRCNQLKSGKKLPEMFEYLGWCSWDAFYQKVNEQGLREKMAELNEKDVPVRWALIDDGWSAVHQETGRLLSLEADREKFPRGIAACAAMLKKEFGIRQVGVWQALMGYWNGVAAEGDAFDRLHPYLEKREDGRLVPKAGDTDAFGFWNTWHSFLKEAGIDFVKVDEQSAVSIFNKGRKSYGRASKAVHTGLEASAAVNFDGRLINCMGMAPQDFWTRPAASLARSSDDFVPEQKDSFREHVVQNAYNSILQGLCYYGDWDMFWSEHSENKRNSMLRAVSGGPVYISDPVGKTNPQWILPLCREDGKLLRCEGNGLPTLDCLLNDPAAEQPFLKVYNRYENAFLVAAYNFSEGEQAIGLHVREIPEAAGDYWVYSWTTGKVQRLSPDAGLPVMLAGNDCDLLLMLPIENTVTVLGILEKYLSVAAVEQLKLSDRILCKIKQGGTFGFIGQRPAQTVLVNGKKKSYEQAENLFTTNCKTGDIIEIPF